MFSSLKIVWSCDPRELKNKIKWREELFADKMGIKNKKESRKGVGHGRFLQKLVPGVPTNIRQREVHRTYSLSCGSPSNPDSTSTPRNFFSNWNVEVTIRFVSIPSWILLKDNLLQVKDFTVRYYLWLNNRYHLVREFWREMSKLLGRNEYKNLFFIILIRVMTGAGNLQWCFKNLLSQMP